MMYFPKPNNPHTKVTDVPAKHKWQANWWEAIVRDKTLKADCDYSAPGKPIRFEIEGQDPFVAVKGSMAPVPMPAMYAMETVGEQPPLRCEVNISEAHTLHINLNEPAKNGGDNHSGQRFVYADRARRRRHARLRSEYAAL